jgi:hypothetical protein
VVQSDLAMHSDARLFPLRLSVTPSLGGPEPVGFRPPGALRRDQTVGFKLLRPVRLDLDPVKPMRAQTQERGPGVSSSLTQRTESGFPGLGSAVIGLPLRMIFGPEPGPS